ncbi:hypothetical protein HFO56_02940 [Rhizobium laguerreae]|nr:hypothetical protein [Rhizobium laguerreae]
MTVKSTGNSGAAVWDWGFCTAAPETDGVGVAVAQACFTGRRGEIKASFMVSPYFDQVGELPARWLPAGLSTDPCFDADGFPHFVEQRAFHHLVDLAEAEPSDVVRLVALEVAWLAEHFFVLFSLEIVDAAN